MLTACVNLAVFVWHDSGCVDSKGIIDGACAVGGYDRP